MAMACSEIVFVDPLGQIDRKPGPRRRDHQATCIHQHAAPKSMNAEMAIRIDQRKTSFEALEERAFLTPMGKLSHYNHKPEVES